MRTTPPNERPNNSIAGLRHGGRPQIQSTKRRPGKRPEIKSRCQA